MKDHSCDCWTATKLISALCRRVMGVRTCESRCLFSGSKGEVCCIEPLHAKVDLRDHPLTQYSLLAMASLTKVTCCLQEAWCERSQRRSSLLCTQTFYFASCFPWRSWLLAWSHLWKCGWPFPTAVWVIKPNRWFLGYGYKHFLRGEKMKRWDQEEVFGTTAFHSTVELQW